MSSEIVKIEAKLPGEEVDKAAAAILTRALGAPADEAGGVLGDIVGSVGDRVKAWRHLNRLRIAKRAAEIIEQEGLMPTDLKALPMREVPEVIAAISDVDQDELAELWAGLLADAMNPKNDRTADKHLVAVLKGMTEEDASLFSALVMSAELRELMLQRGLKASEEANKLVAQRQIDVTEWSERVRQRNIEMTKPCVAFINDKLASLAEGERYRANVENLVALGLVEYGDERNDSTIQSHRFSRLWRRNSEDDANDAVAELAKLIGNKEQLIKHWQKYPVTIQEGHLPSFSLITTPKGERLVEACQIKLPAELSGPIWEVLKD